MAHGKYLAICWDPKLLYSSSVLLLGLLLLNLLLNQPLLLLLLGLLSHLLHLDHAHLVELGVAVGVLALLIHTAVVVVGSTVVIAARNSRERSNSDVLAEELLGGEVVHEVLGGDVGLVLAFLLFGSDLLQLLADGLGNLLEQESQGLLVQLVVEGLDVLAELRIDFLDHSGTPSLYLIIDEVDLLLQLHCLILSLIKR